MFFNICAIVLTQAKVVDTSTISSAALDLIQEPTFLSEEPIMQSTALANMFWAHLVDHNRWSNGAILRSLRQHIRVASVLEVEGSC